MEGRKILSGSKGYHKPVLLREAIDALNPVPSGAGRDAWYIDCTLGDGGHTLKILRRGGKVVGIDVDPQALERAQKRFKDLGYSGILGKRIKLIQGNFRDLKNLISKPASTAKRGEQTDAKDQKFAGAIFDLGVSSLQLETPERGFSFINEGPLDMRMDPNLQVRALDLINAGGRKELNALFSKLGEEKYSWAVADALVLARQVKPLTTTKELAEVIVRAIGLASLSRRSGAGRGKIHPATRVFQALRIAVNDELNALQEGLDQVVDLVRGNGRVVVISFHSLEDRIVKNSFREWEKRGLGKIITNKPIVPGEDETGENPGSRSAKLRIFEKEVGYDYY